jgi:CRP/FNR family transcriptional regulator
MRLRVPAGSMVRREGEPGPHVELVINGLVRVFVSSPDGRTLTVRYCRPGSLVGAVSLFRPSYGMPGGIQALVDTELLVLRADRVRAMSDRERAMADALMAELSDRVYQFVVELPGASFATVRQRVARHLLDLASDEQRGGTRLIARSASRRWRTRSAASRGRGARSASCARRASSPRVRRDRDPDRPPGGGRVRVACDAGSSPAHAGR